MSATINQYVDKEIATLSTQEEKDWFEASRIPPRKETVYDHYTGAPIGQAWIVACVESGPYFLGLQARVSRGEGSVVWGLYLHHDGYIKVYDGPWPTLFGAIEEVWFGLELKPKRVVGL